MPQTNPIEHEYLKFREHMKDGLPNANDAYLRSAFAAAFVTGFVHASRMEDSDPKDMVKTVKMAAIEVALGAGEDDS